MSSDLPLGWAINKRPLNPESLNSLPALLAPDTCFRIYSEHTLFLFIFLFLLSLINEGSRDWREQWMHVWATNSRIVFYSGCWYSTLVCIDQGVRVFCSLNHCVFISPSIHSQSFIVNMALLLGDTATFISCLSSECSNMGGGKKVGYCFMCACVRMTVWETAQDVLSSLRHAVNDLEFHRQLV